MQLINLGLITSNSSVSPDFNTGTLYTSSRTGTIDTISVLNGTLTIDALNVNATAIANGKPGGASALYNWSVADIKLLGTSILDQLRLNGFVELPGVLRIAIGNKTEVVSPDGTYAFAWGDALIIELFNVLPGYQLITLTLGHAEATASVPLGGLKPGLDVGIKNS